MSASLFGARLRPVFRLAFVLCALAFFVPASPLRAAATTYYVSPSGNDNNPGTQVAPFKTIQQAINNTATGDTVTLESGTYSGPGNVDLDTGGKSIMVNSTSGAATAVIDCGGNSASNPQVVHRAFYFHSNETNASISGLTIKNGNESGNGGAVDIESGSTLTLTNCAFTGNTGSPGVVYNAGTVTITGCTIAANTCSYGYVNDDVVYDDHGGTAALTNCTISGNTGGGIYSGGTTTLTNCTITGNTGYYGGGVYVDGTATLSGCAINSNTANNDPAYGGGVYNQGTVTLNGCNISSNVSTSGGGVSNEGTATLTGCVINGNMASSNSFSTSSGGGVYNGGTVTLAECVLIGNTAANNGGGIDNSGFGNNGLGLTLTNCLLTNNVSSSGNGGGVDNEANGTALLQFCTLSANSTSASGTQGGAVENDATATLTDDILWGNTALYAGEIGIATTGNPVTTANYSDIQGGLSGTGNIHQDPLFVNPSGGDYHLKVGSPCLGAGTPITGITTDLDGKTRGNPPSIGAYENPEAAAATGHTHILWNNPDGRVILWSIAPDGSVTFHAFGPYTDGSPNTPWSAKALATGPDGKSHLLWTNPDGHVILWTVDDSGNFTDAIYGPYTDGTPSTPWSAKALSVGVDNLVHILWTNPDGKVILWNVDSTFNFTDAVFGPYTDGAPNTPWSATAIATGPDNVTRLVWNNPDGHVILWDVDNGFNFTYHLYGPYTDGSPSTPWSASAVSVGPDAVTHLLWTNPDGHVILWTVDGAFNFTDAVYGPYTDGSPSTPWSATALATGPDNLSHILWSNPDGHVILWGVDASFSFTDTVYGPYTDGSPSTPWSATAVSAGP